MGVLMAILLMTVQDPAAAALAESASAKKICRRAKTSGSRLREPKQCHTAAEWERLDAAARDDAINARTRARPTG